MLPGLPLVPGGCEPEPSLPPPAVPVIPVRCNVPDYAGPALTWPPGWAGLWRGLPEPRLAVPAPKIKLSGIASDVLLP